MATISISRARARVFPRLKDPAFLIPLAGVGLLGYLTVMPLFMLLLGSFQEEVRPRVYEFTLQNYAAAYASRYTYTTFLNSFMFAFGSSAVGFLIGTTLAWLVERTNMPARNIFVPLAVIPIVLPGVLEAISWIFLLSPKFGYVNLALMRLLGLPSAPFDIFSLGGMIWVQAVGQVPLAFLLMIAAFKSMDPSLEESAMASGASTWRTLRRITLPLLLPAGASVLLILFVRSLEAAEVPAIIGIPARIYVYTSEIYLAFNEFPPNYGRGSALAVGLLILTALGVWLYKRSTSHSERYQTVTGKAFRPRRFDLGRLRWVAFGALSTYFFLVVILPVSVLVWASFLPFFAPPEPASFGLLSLDNYRFLVTFEPFRRSMLNSILLATLSGTVVMLLTSVIAWIVYKSRLRGSWALDFLAFLPIAVPGLVLGMALIMFYVAFPVPIYGTLVVLLIAYVTKYLPYGMRAASGSIVQVHRELEEAASTSGATWRKTFLRITLPLLRPGLVAGWIYICIVSFREFSTSVLLASGQSQVLSILIFTMFEQGQVTVVATIGVLMVIVLVTVVAAFYKLTGRVGIQSA